MKLSRAIAIAAMAGATLVVATGCSVARKQETVGEYIDGSAVTTAVKAQLANDPATSAAAIHVKTIDGGVVQLSGFAKTQAEIDVLMPYLPAQLSEDEIRALVKEAVEKTGASTPKDMGKVMGMLMPKVKGRADGKLVNTIVRSMLQG